MKREVQPPLLPEMTSLVYFRSVPHSHDYTSTSLVHVNHYRVMDACATIYFERVT